MASGLVLKCEFNPEIVDVDNKRGSRAAFDVEDDAAKQVIPGGWLEDGAGSILGSWAGW